MRQDLLKSDLTCRLFEGKNAYIKKTPVHWSAPNLAQRVSSRTWLHMTIFRQSA